MLQEKQKRLGNLYEKKKIKYTLKMRTIEEIWASIMEYETEWRWIMDKLEEPFENAISFYADYNETVHFMRQFHYDENHK